MSYGGAPAPAAEENPNVIVSEHAPGATFRLRSEKLPATVAVCCDGQHPCDHGNTAHRRGQAPFDPAYDPRP